jgi:hypothetical protein
MATPCILQTVDNSRELSRVQFHLAALASDGSNYEAVLGGAASARALMVTALELMTKCNKVKVQAPVLLAEDALSIPADKTAQREVALTVIYQDTTTMAFYRMTIPAPVDALFDAGTDEVDIESNVAMLAFIAVMEANCVSPDGNAINVTRAYRVGRRN